MGTTSATAFGRPLYPGVILRGWEGASGRRPIEKGRGVRREPAKDQAGGPKRGYLEAVLVSHAMQEVQETDAAPTVVEEQLSAEAL